MTKIICNNNSAQVSGLDLYTSGMVGAQISITFTSEWDGLAKTVVFCAGEKQRDVVMGTSDVITIPWEVLTEPNEQLSVGVYGTRGAELVIPTVYAALGRIKTGADPSGDPSIPPTPSILDQALEAASHAIAAAEQAGESAEAAQTSEEAAAASESAAGESAAAAAASASAAATSSASAATFASRASTSASYAYTYYSGANSAMGRAEAAEAKSEQILEEVKDVRTGVQAQIGAINEKIPEQASSKNQLADKEFVNSSVATNTANYISSNGEPFASKSALDAYSGPLTNNDYAFVVGTDGEGNTTYTRYKWVAKDSQWAEEYVLNNSSFTSAQWSTINSGITALGVEQIETNRLAIVDLLNYVALKANDADVYHEWKLGYNSATQSMTKDGAALSFDEVYSAVEDKSKFVYVEVSNRVYIPQYVSSGLIYFMVAYIDSNLIKLERIMFDKNTGKALTGFLSTYSKEKIDELLSAEASRAQTAEAQLQNRVTILEHETALLKEAAKGELYTEVVDSTEAYVKAVPAGTFATTLDSIGGKTVIQDGVLVTATTQAVVSRGVNLFKPNRDFDETKSGVRVWFDKAKNCFMINGTAQLSEQFKIFNRSVDEVIPDGFIFNITSNITSDRLKQQFLNYDLLSTPRIITLNGDRRLYWDNATHFTGITTKYGTTYNNEELRLEVVAGNAYPTEFRPYSESVLDTSALSEKYFPGSMISTPSARQEFDFSDKEAVKRVGAIDMGTLTYDRRSVSSTGFYFVSSEISGAKGNFNEYGITQICAEYQNTSVSDIDNAPDKSIRFGSANKLIIKDNSFTDAAAFKAHLSGKMLYYELADPIITPITEDIDPYITTEAGGTVTFENDQSLPIAVPSTLTHYVDIQEAIS